MTDGSRLMSLGETFSPFDAHLTDPYPFYGVARREEPVFYSPQFDIWCVTRYDDIVQILRDPVTFSSRDTIPHHVFPPEVTAALADYRFPTHLINADPPEHSRLRAIMNQGFNPAAVEAIASTVVSSANSLIDSFFDDGEADLFGQFAYPLPLRVILRVLGVPDADLQQCRTWSENLDAIFWGWATATTDHLVECARGLVAFQRYTESLVADRAAVARDDLISRVLHAGLRDFAALTHEEVVDLVPGLIIAGHQTTADLIGNTVSALLADAPTMRKACEGSISLQDIVEEGLRYDSSILGMPRTATTDVEIAGTSIPAGGKLFLLFGSANHDEKHYVQPDRFLPGNEHRSPHLAFGKGIHFCIGAALARLEGRIALELILQRLSGLRASGPVAPRTPNMIFRGFSRLNVQWDIT
jgi:cytochrome P450